MRQTHDFYRCSLCGTALNVPLGHARHVVIRTAIGRGAVRTIEEVSLAVNQHRIWFIER